MFTNLLLLISVYSSSVTGYQIGNLYKFKYETNVKYSTPKKQDLEIKYFESNLLVQPLKLNENKNLILKLTVCYSFFFKLRNKTNFSLFKI